MSAHSFLVHEGKIMVYRLYDVAYEIDLDAAERIVEQEYPISRLRMQRLRPEAVRFVNPPLTLPMPPFGVDTGGWFWETAQCVVRLFDFGVVSVRLELPVPRDTPMADLEEMVRRIVDEPPDILCRDVARQAVERIGPALDRPLAEWEEEDYLVVYVRSFQGDAPLGVNLLQSEYDFTALLMAEDFPLSDQVRRDVMRHAYAYSNEDLVVLTWETAFVYETDGTMDIPDLLEFANAQLLELQYFDELVDEELSVAYDDIESVSRGWGLLRYRRLNQILNRLMVTIAELSALSERVVNALKLTEDVYYAKVYTGAVDVLGLPNWVESVRRKVTDLQEIYSMLSGEAQTAQFMALEASIVVLILVEIIMALVM